MGKKGGNGTQCCDNSQDHDISTDHFMEHLLIIDDMIYFSLHVIKDKKQNKTGTDLGVMTLGGLVPESVVLKMVDIEKDKQCHHDDQPE